MWCPRCDQGDVNKVRVNKTGEIVHVCEECEALWPSGIDVASTGFIDFKTYVTPLGLEGLWSELTELESEDEPKAN